jgi:eukaryotic-like serine/threonine-protein kinase
MFRYFISREFFLTILALAGGGIVLYLLIFFWFLPIYTRHGDSVVVPDLYEMTLDEARKSLQKEGLRPAAEEEVFVADLPPGVVVRQYPAPYSRVKPGRTITLTVNKIDPPMVPLPQLSDLSLYQAKSRLESWKLGVGKVSREPDIAENIVLRAVYEGKEIKQGDKVPQGAKIELVVGAGLNSGKVPVPSLVGKSYEDALALLEQLGLGLGSVVYNPNGAAGSDGLLYNQQPRAGAGDSIKIGASIDIFVYGKAPEEREGIMIESVPGDNY